MIRVIIVDDEKHGVDRLLHLLKAYEDKLSVVAVYGDVTAALKGIPAYKPDLVFLDVRLGQNQTGFDLLYQLRPVDFQVVFTTAFDAYAVKAFRVSALDYLLKPIDADVLDDTINKVLSATRRVRKQERVDVLLHNLTANAKQRKIGIPTMEGYIFLEIALIVRCESDVNYTTIHAADQKKYLIAKTLKYYEELLVGHGFFRVHNSHLVNLDYVAKYTKGKGGYITLKDQTVIEVSSRRKEDFLKAMS